MPSVSTIESSFVLVDKASGTVDKLKRNVRDLRLEAERAGDAIDRMAGEPKEVIELRQLADATQQLAGGARDIRDALGGPSGTSAMLTRFAERSRAAGRDVDAFRIKVDRLGDSLDRLRTMDPTVRVHLDGVAEARSELALLRKDLRSFGRTSPTATIGVRPGAGGFGGGGGGRSGVFAGTGGFGAFSTHGRLIASAALLGLPVAQSALGAGGALGATLGGAALGAGAVGYGAGLGTAGVGIAGIAAVAAPAKAGLQALAKAQTTYNAAVQDYGRRSLEAARARRELNQAEAAAPAGGQALLRQTSGLRSDWARLTRPGQAALTGAGTSVVRDLRGQAPTLAGFGNQISRSTGTAASQLGAFATAPQQMLLMRALTDSFSHDLPAVERTTEHLATTFGNVARAGLPWLHQGVEFIDKWTAGWARSSGDISATRQELSRWVDDFKTVGHVAGDAFDLMKALFSPGELEGRGMLQEFDDSLQRWTQWAQTNPQKIRDFMHEGATDVERLAKFLGIAVTDLHQMANLLDPIVDRFVSLANLAGGAGLLLPTALRLGVPQLLGRGGGGGMGGGGVGLGVVAGAGAGAGAGRLAGVRGALSRNLGGATSASDALLYARAYGPGAAAAGLGRTAAAGLGAVGRFAAPLALIAGGLGAAETQGPLISRLTGGLHAATLGVVPVETGGSQQRATGASQARAALQRLPASNSPSGIRSNIAHIQGMLATQQGRLPDAVAGALEQPITSLFGDAKRPVRGEVQGQVDQLQQALAAQNKALGDAVRQRNQILDEASREHGTSLADSLQEAFGIETRHGVTSKGALDDVLDHSIAKMRQMRPEGAKVLGDAMLGWASELAHKSPKLEGVVDDFTGRIEKRFSKLRDRVSVVDQTILTGATSEWTAIGKALADPAEAAREKVTASFTAIQRQAVGSLTAMGFSGPEARKLVRGLEGGSSRARQASTIASTGDVYDAAVKLGTRAGPAAPTTVSGNPLSSAGPFGDGPGLGFAESARQSVAASRGGLMGADSNLAPYAAIGRSDGLSVTSGLRPGAHTISGGLSYHATGHAIDMAGSTSGMRKFAETMFRRYGGGLEELITPWPSLNIKSGRPFHYSADVEGEHSGANAHVHVADVDPRGGGGLAAMFSPDTLGPGLQTISLRASRSGLPGVPGALADAASAMYAAGLSSALNRQLGGAGGGGGAVGRGWHFTGDPSAHPWSPARIAALASRFGLPGATFAQIAHGESGYDPFVQQRDPGDGNVGYGLWQLTPHAWGAGSAAMKRFQQLGGIQGMLNVNNQAKMARYLYNAAGHSITPWHGTRFVTGAGDGMGWARPTMRGTGSSVRFAAPRAARGVVHVSPGAIVIHARNADAAEVGRMVGRQLGRFADQVYDAVANGPEETE